MRWIMTNKCYWWLLMFCWLVCSWHHDGELMCCVSLLTIELQRCHSWVVHLVVLVIFDIHVGSMVRPWLRMSDDSAGHITTPHPVQVKGLWIPPLLGNPCFCHGHCILRIPRVALRGSRWTARLGSRTWLSIWTDDARWNWLQLCNRQTSTVKR